MVNVYRHTYATQEKTTSLYMRNFDGGEGSTSCWDMDTPVTVTAAAEKEGGWNGKKFKPKRPRGKSRLDGAEAGQSCHRRPHNYKPAWIT